MGSGSSKTPRTLAPYFFLILPFPSASDAIGLTIPASPRAAISCSRANRFRRFSFASSSALSSRRHVN